MSRSTTGVLFDDLTNAGARPRQGAAAAAGAMLGLPGLPERRRGDDPDRDSIVDLINTMPDFQKSKRTQRKILEAKKRREAAEAARAAARVAVDREVEEIEEELEQAGRVVQQAEGLKAQLWVNLEDELESEAVLASLPLPQEGGMHDIDLEGEYLEAMAGARAALGLDDLLPELAASKEDRLELFCASLRSGYVRTVALKRGSAGQPLVPALLTVMTQSPDAETAGAAFFTLMALLGDEMAGGSGGGRALQASPHAGGGSGALLLDAHYGVPASQLPAFRLDYIPTDRQLLEALRDNGYQPGAAGGGGRGGRQQRGAATPEQQQQQQQPLGAGGSAEGEQQQAQEGTAVRLQAIKLILRTAAAVCRYCKAYPAAAVGALSREGVGDLLLAAVHMGLDPAANQLQEDLDAAVVALLGALDEADWSRKLPQLADRLVEFGPSHVARLKLLRKLPTAHPRGFALQQFAAAVLLERLPRAAKAGAKSAVNRREPDQLDPAAVVAAQPWFSDGKGLVVGATSGGKEPPRSGYKIDAVTLLLRVCHLLLWPHMLQHAAGEPSCISQQFLQGWYAFLVALQKNIRSMQPEDQGAKALAVLYENETRNLIAEGAAPMSP